MYPWPIGDLNNAMDVALDTAMNYLNAPGSGGICCGPACGGDAIVAAWKMASGTGFGWLISRSSLWNGKRSRFQKIKSAANDEISDIEYTVVQASSAASSNGPRRLRAR